MASIAIDPSKKDRGNRSLDRAELTDIIDLTLWAGQLLLQHGSDSNRVEETMHRIATALGCDWADIFVSTNDLAITTISGNEFRTKLRRVVRIGVNMTTVSAISRLSRRIQAGELDRFAVRSELNRISQTPHHYNRWLTVLMVGLACASFSRLFGGGWIVFGVTWISAAVAMVVRQELTKRYFNSLLVVVVTAATAGLLASTATWFRWSNDSAVAMVASVLLLVPGVPLINAVEDITEGYVVVGLTRGVIGLLISLAIAIGLLVAMSVVGIKSL